MVTKPEPLPKELADGLENWILPKVKEAYGKGTELLVDPKTGASYTDHSFEIADFFKAIHQECPEAITRMLEAGAAAYVKAPEDDDHA